MNHYAITKDYKENLDGSLSFLWVVSLARQRKLIRRRFFFSLYGGEQNALLMAQAYRDAALRLFPPKTQRQKHKKPRANNTSGVPGVSRIVRHGYAIWQAHIGFMDEQGRHRIADKCFYVHLHGEEGAKAMAIAKREEFLTQYEDRFATITQAGTELSHQLYPGMLGQHVFSRDPEQDMDIEEVNRVLAALNAWFDALRPLHVYAIARWRNYASFSNYYLEVRVTDCGFPARSKVRCIQIIPTRGEKDVLGMTWDFVQARITLMFGETEWLKFSTKYRGAFFSMRFDTVFKVCDWYVPPDEAERRKPPPILAPYLGDFEIPSIYPHLVNEPGNGLQCIALSDTESSTPGLALLPGPPQHRQRQRRRGQHQEEADGV